ncbi:hypothetical protein BDN70DRAFT_830395 [Pholiota conissans]|uniref:Glycosyl transferase CAP10 domain-containing protein n=1 Tax=Pholiota conissans TaxID=109636 RepID=A0A9P6D3L2_9AGAR|nr:hypothetical protein BDN70DRAFT_830395 [Pholiota conissans]
MSLLRSRRGLKLFLYIFLIGFVFFELASTLVPQYGQDSDASYDLASPPSPPSQTPTVNVAQPQRQERPLGKHRYRPNGLLEVNQDGPHPIYELIARAERDWEAKLQRASKTLEEAVMEYKRRYGRRPPKGFDVWWKYAMEHDVQLPDEYDRIQHDLEGFWGLEPADLVQIQQETEVKKDSYTIGKNETGEVEVVTYAFEEGRYDQLIVGSREIVRMLNQIQDILPPFRITLSPHDGPNRLTDHGIKQALMDAVEARTYIDRASLPKINSIGWVSACPPDSPARQMKINLDEPPPRPTKKTFIYDHVATMDPCNHPDHFFHHGQFLSHNLGPSPQRALFPEFSYCSTTIHHNIRIPVPYGWVEDIYPRTNDPEWDDKVDERLLWRGSNTGMYHSATSRWEHSHRDFFVWHANELEGTLKVLQPNKTRNEKVGEPRELRKARVNPALMDVAFAGNAIGCSPAVCDLLEDKYPFRERQSIAQAGNYKYVMDVDGNGWSGRFKRLITTNALIFKSTIYPEWYADRVAPWVHYVPIQIDLSDLYDALFFFRGDGNGDGAHEHLARKIAVAGRQWSKTFWRKEDLIAYFFRLILEYNRLSSLDRDAMSYSE